MNHVLARMRWESLRPFYEACVETVERFTTPVLTPQQTQSKLQDAALRKAAERMGITVWFV